MPATSVPPTLDQYLERYAAAVQVDAGVDRNTRRGSGYDIPGGMAAIIWARQSLRIRDVFRQIYTDTATGNRFDDLVLRKYGVERVRQSYGAGAALLSRLVAGSDGTIYTGTRILVAQRGLPPLQYAVVADKLVGADETAVAVDVRPTRPGTGVAIHTTTGLSLGDTVFDTTFAPVSLVCADGTDDEDPTACLDRARRARFDARVGYRKRIEQACRDAGAANVVLLDAGDLGDDNDSGVSHVYVADASYTTTAALLDACFLALEDVRVAGCDLQVHGMAITPLTAAVTLRLWSYPAAFDQIALKRSALAALLAEFNGRPDAWLFRYDALAGAASRTSSAIQAVEITTDPPEPTAGFVATLPRYTLAGSDVAIEILGPA